MVSAILIITYNQNVISDANMIGQVFEDFIYFSMEHVTCWYYSKWKSHEFCTCQIDMQILDLMIFVKFKVFIAWACI